MPSKTPVDDRVANVHKLKAELPDAWARFCGATKRFFGKDAHTPEGAALHWLANRPAYIADVVLRRSAGDSRARPSARDRAYTEALELELQFRAHLSAPSTQPTSTEKPPKAPRPGSVGSKIVAAIRSYGDEWPGALGNKEWSRRSTMSTV